MLCAAWCGACFSMCATHRWTMFYCPWTRAGSKRQCLCRVPLSHGCELLATLLVDASYHAFLGYDDFSWLGMPPPGLLFPQSPAPGTSWVPPLMQAEQSNHTARLMGPGALQAKNDRIVNKKLPRTDSNAAVVKPQPEEEANRTYAIV